VLLSNQKGKNACLLDQNLVRTEGGKPMEICIVAAEKTDYQGHTLATQALWPIHGPPEETPLLVIALATEDFPLAIATARHWGSLTRQRDNQAALLITQNGDPIPPQITEQMKDHQLVIVATRLDCHNVDLVTKMAAVLGQENQGTITVGVLVDEAGKHKELVVQTPSGA